MGGKQILSPQTLNRISKLLTGGMSQGEVAAEVGVAKSTVWRIAHGEHRRQQPVAPVSIPKISPEPKSPSPEEIEARAWAIRMGWTETKERGREVTKPVPYTFPVVKESWLLGEKIGANHD